MADVKLSIFGGAPHASLLGAMVFPRDPLKAEIYAGYWMARAIGKAPDHLLVRITPDTHRWAHAMSTRYPAIHKEAERSLFRGTQAGALVSYLWREASASWEDALLGVEKVAGASH